MYCNRLLKLLWLTKPLGARVPPWTDAREEVAIPCWEGGIGVNCILKKE